MSVPHAFDFHEELNKVSMKIDAKETQIQEIDIDTIELKKEKEENLSPEERVADRKYDRLTRDLQELKTEKKTLLGKVPNAPEV